MYYKPFITILAVGILSVGIAFAPLVALAETPQAKVTMIEGATTTYKVEDREGKIVKVEVPSSSVTSIRTNPSGTNTSAQSGQPTGTIPASVVAIDTLSNQVKVVTQAGQTLHLEIAAQDIQIGEQFTLVVPR